MGAWVCRGPRGDVVRPRAGGGQRATSGLFAGNPPGRLPPQSITALRVLRLGSGPLWVARESVAVVSNEKKGAGGDGGNRVGCDLIHVFRAPRNT